MILAIQRWRQEDQVFKAKLDLHQLPPHYCSDDTCARWKSPPPTAQNSARIAHYILMIYTWRVPGQCELREMSH